MPGISGATVMGEADYAMRLWLDPDKMANRSLSVTDIQAALREQNVQVAAGKIGGPPFDQRMETEFTLRVKGRLQDVQEFENIVLRARPDGSAIYLRDVARVELGQSSYGFYGEISGRPAVNVALYQASDANALEVGNSVDALVADLAQAFPAGMAYQINYDTTRYVSTAVSQVVQSLLVAVLLVVLITFLFLGSLRATLVPAVTIPVSLVSSLAVLFLLGMSINTMTLFALILAIGVVVDDAILVIENCDRHLRADPELHPRDAALQTMREVGGAIIATTLVLLAVFLPVAALPGITGEMYRQFGVTICVAVVFSSINALTLSPALCALLLQRGGQRDAGWYRVFLAGFARITGGYTRGVDWVLRKLLVVGLIFIAWMGALAVGVIATPTALVPDEDKGALLVNIQLPDAASLLRTRDAVRKVSDIIAADGAVQSVTEVTGFSILTGAMASNAATLFVVLKHWDDRQRAEELVFNVAQRINQQAFLRVPEAQVVAIAPPAIPGMGAVGGLELMLQDTLSRGPTELATVLNNFIVESNSQPALAGVFSTFRANVPQYFIDVDRVKAKNLGVPLSEVFLTLQAQLGWSIFISSPAVGTWCR